MIAATQALIVKAVVDHRGLQRVRSGERDREIALAMLEAELEELNLKGYNSIPPAYRPRYGQLLDAAQLTDAERKGLAAHDRLGALISVILDHLMAPPAALPPESRYSCAFCGGPRPTLERFCSEDCQRRDANVQELLTWARSTASNLKYIHRWRDRHQPRKVRNTALSSTEYVRNFRERQRRKSA